MVATTETKRPRPVRRWLAIFGVVLLFVVALGGEAARRYGPARLAAARVRFEAEVGPLDLAKYARPEVPEERNAATWITRAAELVPLKGAPRNELDGVWVPLSAWSQEDLARWRQTSVTYGPTLEIVSRCRNLSESTLHLEVEDGVAAWPPNVLGIVRLAQLLAGRARLRVHEGDTRRALDDLETLGSAADVMFREPVLLSVLVGTAFERLEIGVLRDIVERQDLSPDEVRRAEAALPDEDLLGSFARAHAFDVAAMNRVFDQDVTNRPLRDSLAPRNLLGRLGVMRTHAGFLEFHLGLADLLGRPYPELSRELDALTARIRAEYSTQVWGLHIPGHEISTYGRLSHLLSLRRVARTALALRMAGTLGAYPQSIDGNAGKDPFTGGMMTWETNADGSGRLEAPVDRAWLEAIFTTDPLQRAVSGSWTLPPPRNPLGRPSTARSSFRSRRDAGAAR